MHGRCEVFFRTLSATVVAFLLLISGVEQNPGVSVKCGFINVRSIVRKRPLVQDIISTQQIQLLAIAGAWISKCHQTGLSTVRTSRRRSIAPRPTTTVANRGDGLRVVHHESLSVNPIQNDNA